MVELNAYLQPIGSPITEGVVTSSMDLDSSLDRDSITISKIKNFNFNSGYGGTLTLGGTQNGNGELYLNNASGSLMIWGSRLGLIGFDGQGTAANNIQFWLDTIDTSIYKGSVNIRDANDSAVVDIYGINSLNVFPQTDASSNSLNQLFTGTTPTSATGGTLTFTVNRASQVLILCTTTSFISGTAGGLNGYYDLWIDSTDYTQTRMHYTNLGLETGANHYIYSAPSAGTYSVYLKGVLNNGPGTMTLYSFNMSYVKLGK